LRVISCDMFQRMRPNTASALADETVRDVSPSLRHGTGFADTMASTYITDLVTTNSQYTTRHMNQIWSRVRWQCAGKDIHNWARNVIDTA